MPRKPKPPFADFRLPNLEISPPKRRRQWVMQADIQTDNIRQRHVGPEGIRYIRAGLAAERPVTDTIEGAMYFSFDTDVLNIWNGTSWVQLQFT